MHQSDFEAASADGGSDVEIELPRVQRHGPAEEVRLQNMEVLRAYVRHLRSQLGARTPRQIVNQALDQIDAAGERFWGVAGSCP